MIFFDPKNLTFHPKTTKRKGRTKATIACVNLYKILRPCFIYVGLDGTRFTYAEDEIERNIRPMNTVYERHPLLVRRDEARGASTISLNTAAVQKKDIELDLTAEGTLAEKLSKNIVPRLTKKREQTKPEALKRRSRIMADALALNNQLSGFLGIRRFGTSSKASWRQKKDFNEDNSDTSSGDSIRAPWSPFFLSPSEISNDLDLRSRPKSISNPYPDSRVKKKFIHGQKGNRSKFHQQHISARTETELLSERLQKKDNKNKSQLAIKEDKKKARQGQKKERRKALGIFGKQGHINRDLERIGRLDPSGSMNFEVHLFEPTRITNQLKIRHLKFPGIGYKIELQPFKFYLNAIGWPLYVERQWITRQQASYQFETRVTPLFLPSTGLGAYSEHLSFAGHGKNVKDADRAAMLRMLGYLADRLRSLGYDLEDLLPGMKFGVPLLDPEPLRHMPLIQGSVVKLIFDQLPIEVLVKFHYMIEIEKQRLSELGEMGKVRAWQEFCNENLARCTSYIEEMELEGKFSDTMISYEIPEPFAKLEDVLLKKTKGKEARAPPSATPVVQVNQNETAVASELGVDQNL